MEIGHAVRELRARAKLTADDLADRSGTTKSSISRIESGKQTPTLDMLERIAAALNVPLYQLIALAEHVALPVAGTTPQEHLVLEAMRIMEADARDHYAALASAVARAAAAAKKR